MNGFFSKMGISWAHMEWSWLIFLIPVVLVLIFLSNKKRANVLRSLGISAKSEAFEKPYFRTFKSICSILGFLFLIIAAIGPQWGQKEHATQTQGLDMCLALDISKSMLAEDQSPNRLKNTKNSLSLFLPRLGGDRVTVVGFAGSSYVAAPLSIDHQALLSFIDVLDPDFMSDSSTNIPQALETCLTALGLEKVKSSAEILDNSSKAILIVSDGEDTVDDRNDVQKQLKKLNVPVYAMVVGTRAGAPIPIRDDEGKLTGYIKENGAKEPAITKLQDKYLKELTSETGGELFYSEQGITAWNQLEKSLGALKRDTKEAGKRLDLEARFVIPLLIAFLFLLLDFFLPETKFSFKDIKDLFKFFVFIALLSSTQKTFAITQDPRAVFKNNGAISDFDKKDNVSGVQKLDDALSLESTSLELRYNWATGRLKSAPQSQEKLPTGEPAKVNREFLNQSLKELENLEKDLSNTQKPSDQILKSKIKFQKGSALEMIGENQKALDSYYEGMARNNDLPKLEKDEKNKLNEMFRKNISRLITQIEQNQKSGGGGGGGGGGGEGKDKKNDPNSDQGKDPKQPPKEGGDADQRQRQEKFTGNDIDEQQAKQILQSVSGEEKAVLKRKAQGESKERLRKKGDPGEGEPSQGKPW